MALPLTRDTTYVAGTTPTIKAADLNKIQDYEIHAFQGTRSIKKIEVDGTSDQATSVPTGGIRVSTNKSASTTPTTVVSLGDIFRESITFAWVSTHIDFGTGDTTLSRGYNLHSFTRNAAGSYTVVFSDGLSDPARAMVQISLFEGDPGAGGTEPFRYAATRTSAAGKLQIDMTTTDSMGTVMDIAFSIEVKGW